MDIAKVPKSLARRAIEVVGWMELGCAEHALEKLEPLLETPGSRPFALKLRIQLCIDLHRYDDALAALDEIRPFEDDLAWLDLTEAWCHKRTDALPKSIQCMERLIDRSGRCAIGHFNLGCYLALSGAYDRAIEEVTIACGLDEKFRELLADERDLDSVRDDVRFRQLLPRR